MSRSDFRQLVDKYRLHGVNGKAKVLSVASGKGGVGKTFFSTNIAKHIADEGKKVLLIDCDVYLSNCYLSLGVTPSRNIFDLLNGVPLEECITQINGVDLLSGTSGIEIESDVNFVETVIRVIQSLDSRYDFIILDCPAGIERRMLSLMSFSDERLLVLNPDKYSLTDCYGLIKTLRKTHGVSSFSLVVNKCDDIFCEKNVTRSILNTCNSFLPDVSVKPLGRIEQMREIELADREKISTAEVWSNIFSYLIDRDFIATEKRNFSVEEEAFQVSI